MSVTPKLVISTYDKHSKLLFSRVQGGDVVNRMNYVSSFQTDFIAVCRITLRVEADAGKMLPLTFIKYISFESSSNRETRLRVIHNKALRSIVQTRGNNAIMTIM
jgi:hypothetical protein